MSKCELPVLSADNTIDVFVQDSSSTTGAGLTGLVHNSAGLTCYYRKGAKGTPTALALVTQTVTGAHADGGFVAVDGVNCPGQYRLDLSDTIVASAGIVTLYLQGAANMAPVVIEIEVVAANKFTGLPNPGFSGTLRVFGAQEMTGRGLAAASATRASKLVCDALGCTESNLAVDDSQVADPVPMDTIGLLTITAADNSLMALGYNNYRYTGNTLLATLDDFERGLGFLLAQLTVPTANMIFYDGAVTYTGTWTNNPILGRGVKQSETIGDYLEFIVTGSTVLIGAPALIGSVGAAEIKVDGVVKGSISVYMQQSSYNAGGAGRAYQGKLYRISGLTNGPHTVRITITNGVQPAYFCYGAGLNGTPQGAKVILLAPPTMPVAGYALGTPLNNGTDAIAAQYIARVQALAAMLRSDGCRIYCVDSRLRTDRHYQAGNIDWNESGHQAIYQRILDAVLIDEARGRLAETSDNLGDVNGKLIGQGTGVLGGNGAQVDKTGYGLADGAITAAKFAAGAIDNAAIATDAIGSAEVAASAVTKIQAGLSTLTEALVNAQADAALADAGVTGVRMAFLDKLNITGNVASSGEVTSIQNNTRVVRTVPSTFERPDSGSTAFRVEVFIYDENGNMEEPDSAPTISVVNESGASRDANLDSTTMTLVDPGRYRSTYTIGTAHALEQLLFAFSVVEGGATRSYGNTGIVVDTTAVDFTAADRVKLDALHDTRLTAARAGFLDSLNGHVAQTGDVYPIANSGTHGNAALKTLVDAKPSAAANATALLTDLLSSSDFNTAGSFGKLIKDNLNAAVDSRMATFVYTTPPTAAAIATQVDTTLSGTHGAGSWSNVTVADKSGFKLASDGLNLIDTSEPDGPAETWPARQDQVWRRFFKKVEKDADEIKTYADDGISVITTQTYSIVGAVETVDAAT